ncbi:MAG: hypothetical protein ACREPM_25270, partial [Gemmatimonadaceae bacterium]
VFVCPEGPAGTYSYSVSVTIPANWTNGASSGVYGPADIALASDAEHQTPVVSPQTFTIPTSNSAASCVLVFQVLKSIDYVNTTLNVTQDPVRLVTITQLSAQAGTQLDSIVSTTGGDPDVILLAPSTTVTVDPNAFHGSVAAFWNSLPAVCNDVTATNFGGPLPCVFPPPCPGGSFTFSLNQSGDLSIVYDQFPAPNDNSYGVNAVGWGKTGHKFNDLVGSDHAGFELLDASKAVKLSFNVDYLTASTTAPSGYASLGVVGGDGKMLVGTSTGITATTSLANNLNNINIPGLFNAAHVQQFGSVNVLINSPPTDPAHLTYNNSDPLLAGWDFHDTYFVTITAAKLASIGFDPNTWTVEPNADQLHNSPAKACPATGGGGGACALAETKVQFQGKQVMVTIANNAATDVFLSDLVLNWPTTNGKLMQVKLDGDIVYDNPDISGGSAHLTLAQLVADQNKRKIDHGTSDVLTFIFEKNADTSAADYSSTLMFGNCTIVILPL